MNPGDRVQLAEKAKEAVPRLEALVGTVVELDGDMVRVLIDGEKTPRWWVRSFWKVVARRGQDRGRRRWKRNTRRRRD
jgi:hypothetical protein